MAEKVIIKRDTQCPNCGVQVLKNETGYEKNGSFFCTLQCAIDWKMSLRRTLPPPTPLTFGEMDDGEEAYV